MKKRIISGVMAALMLILVAGNQSAFTSTSIYANDTELDSVKCGNNAIWTLDATINQLVISGTGTIDRYTFPKNVDSVVIGEGITGIGANAFANSTIKEVSFPDTLTDIGDVAFWGCEQLETLTIAKGLNNIGDAAFEKCTSLTEVIVDEENDYFTAVDGVLYNKTITELILYPASKLDEVYYVPATVSIIRYCAVDYNNYLKEIHIPEKVYTFGEGSPFIYAKSLEKIVVDDGNRYYSSYNGDLYDKARVMLIRYAAGKTDKKYESTTSVQDIDEYAFQGSKHLETIVLSKHVKAIGYSAFSECDELREFRIENPNCSISSSILSGTLENGKFVLYGYDDSTAMNYAESNKVPFVALQEKEISLIEISSMPIKTVYALGEKFNGAGLVIKVIYSDGTFAERSIGYEVGEFVSDTVGKKQLTITYAEKQTSIEVDVVEELEKVFVESGETTIVNIIEPGQVINIYFTPTASAVYDFYALSNSDTVGYLCDLEGNILLENDDATEGSSDFLISYMCEEGTTYILACKLLNSEELGSFDVVVKRQKEEETTPQQTTANVETSTVQPTTTARLETTTVKPTTKKNEKETTVKKPSKVKNVKVKRVGKRKIQVKWSKVKNVTGYQIRYCKNKAFKKKVKTIKKIKSKYKKKSIKVKYAKVYYVQVRAYRKVKGVTKYGTWSKKKKVKLKK